MLLIGPIVASKTAVPQIGTDCRFACSTSFVPPMVNVTISAETIGVISKTPISLIATAESVN